jgi:hypothetical protein
MKELTQLNDEAIVHIMMRRGYTREQAESAWSQFKLHMSARRFLGPLEVEWTSSHVRRYPFPKW